jgi:hypothetical protein
MGAKLKAKKNLQNSFFNFLNRFFCASGFKVFKSANMPKQYFFKSKKISKNAEFHAQNKVDEHE